MPSIVSYALNSGIATITLDDGKANAFSLPLQAGLNAALDQAQQDQAVVVLAGRPGVFSAGFHLPTLQRGGEDAVSMLHGGFAITTRLLTFPTPVVVACTGHAIAMGVFALMCGDYSVGAEGDFKIGANEVALGLTMPRAAVEICRARLAPAHFQRAMLTSEIYPPTTAVTAGFLDGVVPAPEVLSAAQAVATNFRKLSMPAYRTAKELVREPMLKAYQAGVEADKAFFASFGSPVKSGPA